MPIEAGADVKRKNYRELTALHVFDNVNIMRKLIEAGANVNANGRPSGHCTPLFYATSAEAIDLLIEAGADIKAKNISGRRPLHSVSTGEAAKALIKAGADIHARDLSGSTPLHWAAFEYRSDVAAELIKAGPKVNVRDYHFSTPLNLLKKRHIQRVG